MSHDYSKNILVQESAGHLLERELGWQVAFAYNTEPVSYTHLLILNSNSLEETQMAVSYNRLWKLLIDKKMRYVYKRQAL